MKGNPVPSRNPTLVPSRATAVFPCPPLIGGLNLLVCLVPLLAFPFVDLPPLPALSRLLLELGGVLLFHPGAWSHT